MIDGRIYPDVFESAKSTAWLGDLMPAANRRYIHINNVESTSCLPFHLLHKILCCCSDSKYQFSSTHLFYWLQSV